ncbi:hypothetical protein [Streptomyces sp. NPDC060031]|uniref:hypothetical protein n=1 Tax=Streptomyces sp. NPDC060031 TaxID=3347043 RepID=UPI0036BB1A3D
MTDDAEMVLEDCADSEPVDLSRLHAAMEQHGREWRAQLGKQLAAAAAAAVAVPVFPRFTLPPVVEADRFRRLLGRQLVDLTGFNDVLRGLFEPAAKVITDHWRDQWRDMFSSIGDLVRNL